MSSSNMVCDLKNNELYGVSSGVNNGRQSEKLLNYDGEHSDKVQTSYKEEGLDTCRLQTDCDVMANSMITLQSVQEALEKEIQKFEEIGSISIFLSDSYSTGQTFAEDTAFQLNVDSEVHLLESKLEEVLGKIKAKEYQITKLESLLNGRYLPQEASVSTSQEKYGATEIELDGLFKQKIEYEVEHLIVLKTIEKMSVMAEDQISLFEEQNSLAGEQIQMLHKLKDAEHKAVALKSQAEKLEASCEQRLVTDKALRMQNRLYEYTLCFTAQIILLLILLVIFILRPQTSEVVPT